MNEGLIFDKSSIESFRVIPFREIFNDEKIRNPGIEEMEKKIYSSIRKNIPRESRTL